MITNSAKFGKPVSRFSTLLKSHFVTLETDFVTSTPFRAIWTIRPHRRKQLHHIAGAMAGAQRQVETHHIRGIRPIHGTADDRRDRNGADYVSMSQLRQLRQLRKDLWKLRRLRMVKIHSSNMVEQNIVQHSVGSAELALITEAKHFTL